MFTFLNLCYPDVPLRLPAPGVFCRGLIKPHPQQPASCVCVRLPRSCTTGLKSSHQQHLLLQYLYSSSVGMLPFLGPVSLRKKVCSDWSAPTGLSRHIITCFYTKLLSTRLKSDIHPMTFVVCCISHCIIWLLLLLLFTISRLSTWRAEINVLWFNTLSPSSWGDMRPRSVARQHVPLVSAVRLVSGWSGLDFWHDGSGCFCRKDVFIDDEEMLI